MWASFKNYLNVTPTATVAQNMHVVVDTSQKWAGRLLSQHQKICGVFVHPDGTVYYTSEGKLWKIVPHQTKSECLSDTKDIFLEAIVWDGNNVLYMTDQNNKIIQFELKNGHLSILSGSKTSTYTTPFTLTQTLKNASYTYLSGITMHNNNLYVSDCHKIYFIDLTHQTVQRIAGSRSGAARGMHADGEATAANFDQPGGLVVTPDGTIFVCDTGNHCIRTIVSGQVSTLVGFPRQRGHQDGSFDEALFSHPQGIYLASDALLVADLNGLRRIDVEKRKVTTLWKHTACQAVTADSSGRLYLAAKYGLFVLDSAWHLERFLWIAKKKEEASYCPLASLPVDIIKEIGAYLLT